MAWNKPGEEKVKVKGEQRSVHLRGLVAGAVVVIGAAVAAWFILGGGSAPVREGADGTVSRRIKEVTPAAAPKAETVVKRDRYWEHDTTNGLNLAQRRKWWAAHRPAPHWTNDTARTQPRPKYAIFSHRSENEIAAYLTAEPGQAMVGTPRYGPRYVEDFLKSCEEPIIVSKDDDEYVRDLKRAMIQTKIDLRERMNAGEDLGQILLDTRAELQRLAGYRRELERTVREQALGENVRTSAELDDMIKAANKMLEAKGIAPMKLGPIAKRAMLLRAAERGVNVRKRKNGGK